MGSFTGGRLFSTGMTLFNTGMVRFITGLMRLALTRDALRANVVEPAVRSDIGVLQLVRLRNGDLAEFSKRKSGSQNQASAKLGRCFLTKREVSILIYRLAPAQRAGSAIGAILISTGVALIGIVSSSADNRANSDQQRPPAAQYRLAASRNCVQSDASLMSCE
jgi:hypothetical protein